MKLTTIVADIIRDQIISGQIPPGNPIPSQIEMAERLGVRVPTVVQAVATLRDEGYVLTIPHEGACGEEYVRPREDWQ